MEKLHDHEIHHTHRIKAHQSINPQDDLTATWLKLGNFVADEAAKAKASLKKVPEMADLAQKIATHNKRMLVAYNKKTQIDAGLDASQQAVSQHENHTMIEPVIRFHSKLDCTLRSSIPNTINGHGDGTVLFLVLQDSLSCVLVDPND